MIILAQPLSPMPHQNTHTTTLTCTPQPSHTHHNPHTHTTTLTRTHTHHARRCPQQFERDEREHKCSSASEYQDYECSVQSDQPQDECTLTSFPTYPTRGTRTIHTCRIYRSIVKGETLSINRRDTINFLRITPSTNH